MKKYLLLLVLIPLISKAQFWGIMEDYNKDYKAVSKTKGNVKSITVNGKTVNDKDNSSKNMISTNIEIMGDDVFTTINYNRNGAVLDFIVFDTLKHYYSKTSYLYDTLNRLIESTHGIIKSNKLYTQKYYYDSLNRLVQTKYYDTLNNVAEIEVCLYNADTTTNYYILSKHEHNRTVLVHQKNTTITLNYSPDGKDLYFKSIETIHGETIDKKSECYNIADKYIWQSSTQFTSAKKNIWKRTSYNKKGDIMQVTKSKCFNKYNMNGDLSESTSHSDIDYKYKGSYWENTSYKYIYDAHGNYIKKLGYVDGEVKFETTRMIEYYN